MTLERAYLSWPDYRVLFEGDIDFGCQYLLGLSFA